MNTYQHSPATGHLTVLALSIALRDTDPEIRTEARDAIEELNQAIRRERRGMTELQPEFEEIPV